MHEYGTTREQLAAVAVAARGWANLNPEAFMRGPLTVQDVLASRMVSSPLTVRDCCLVTDGGAAVVMTRADRARHLPKRPVYLLGAAAATTHMNIVSMADLTRTAAIDSGQRAFAMAGLGPQDVDVVELYDAFTINTLFLEDLGLRRGEGGPFVPAAPLRRAAGCRSTPTAAGCRACIRACTACSRSSRPCASCAASAAAAVSGAEVALCHGNGGVLSSQITNPLGTDATL